MAGPTVIPTVTVQQFAERLAALFPNGWASADAKQGGNAYALMLAMGTPLAQLIEQVQYADRSVLITTATAPELDLASIDFFGTALPRPPGLSDALFAQLIQANLFKPAATRLALSNALLALTGKHPRMLEPWNPSDTGAWSAPQVAGSSALLSDPFSLPIYADGGPVLGADNTGWVSYWNVDTRANPARWGSPGQRAQGFIETANVPVPLIGPNNPVLGWGDGAYWNVPGYLFASLQPVGQSQIYGTVDRLRAFGVTVWVRFVANPQ